MEFVFAIIGALGGSLFTIMIITANKLRKMESTGHSFFIVEAVDDDNTGFYNVNVRIPSNQDLLNLKELVLEKETRK